MVVLYEIVQRYCGRVDLRPMANQLIGLGAIVLQQRLGLQQAHRRQSRQTRASRGHAQLLTGLLWERGDHLCPTTAACPELRRTAAAVEGGLLLLHLLHLLHLHLPHLHLLLLLLLLLLLPQILLHHLLLQLLDLLLELLDFLLLLMLLLLLPLLLPHLQEGLLSHLRLSPLLLRRGLPQL